VDYFEAMAMIRDLATGTIRLKDSGLQPVPVAKAARGIVVERLSNWLADD